MATSTFILTVSELTKAIKFKLEADFSKVYVQGEVSNFKRQSSGHLYFTLKDANAQIQAVMFSTDARSLPQDPKIGDQVQVIGELNVYPPRGNYQIVVRSLKSSGLGQLLLLLEERKKKYLNLGYFSKEHKKPIPLSPKTIGVITSPTGAVIRDILQILHRRTRGYHVLLYPVRVQGEGAKEDIRRAIDDFNHYKLADVLILARGGGSMEDLWSFNEPEVVESVYRSQIPLISAVGHETDTTLADLVADLRAPTPSAAAELVSLESSKTFEKLVHYQTQCFRILISALNEKKRALRVLQTHPFILSPSRLLQSYAQKIDEAYNQLLQVFNKRWQEKKDTLAKYQLWHKGCSPVLRLEQARHRLAQLQKRFDQHFFLFLQSKRQKLPLLTEKLDAHVQALIQGKKLIFEKTATHLQAIHPKRLLEQGYSILFDENKDCVILSSKDITLKQKIKVVLKDGFVKASVDEIYPGAP